MTKNMTKHAHIDRFDRISAIIDLLNGDFGEVIMTAPAPTHNDGRYQELTSNGVVIIKGADGMVITMYLCSIKKAQFFGASTGKMLTRKQWEKIRAIQKYKNFIE